MWNEFDSYLGRCVFTLSFSASDLLRPWKWVPDLRNIYTDWRVVLAKLSLQYEPKAK